MEYRKLTDKEIITLEDQSCRAEDWSSINVAEDFKPNHMHRVMLYGEVNIGAFEKSIEVSKDFFKHTGINNATLRNVTIGDNCLIENIGNYINNYTIGDDCLISNISTIETTEGATFGEGNLISVLNEVGDGNVVLFKGLGSQLAAFMVKHANDRELKESLRRIIREEMATTSPERGTIGNRVKIVNTKEITNTAISDDCEINGAARLSDTTLIGSADANVYVGTGVICENTIVCEGSSIVNAVKIQDCFVGEACHISNGFTASASVFFANSHMSNGEARAAFCGPFTTSHHKNSLLISGMFSFYNAGSGTNISNHAYKMGPIHRGTLERGTKTAGGAYLLMPATIGTFSVCYGKLIHHPDTRNLPFSHLVGGGDTMYLSPGRNITSAGLYRDIKKWPKRDLRPKGSKKSIINLDWLSPFSVGEIVTGKKILEDLQAASGEDVSAYNFHKYVIKASWLKKGIKCYDLALRIYMGEVLKRMKRQDNGIDAPTTDIGTGTWNDLAGLLLPDSEEQRIARDIKNGTLDTVDAINERFQEIDNNYRSYQWAWTYRLILDYYGLDQLSEEDAEAVRQDSIAARRAWIAEIRKDAEKEFRMGDVEQEVIDRFVNSLDHESEYED